MKSSFNPRTVYGEITKVSLRQPCHSPHLITLRSRGQIAAATINDGTSFCLEIEFLLNQDWFKSENYQSLRYQVQSSAENIETKAITPIAEGQVTIIQQHQFSYSYKLPPATLPQGLYCLRAVVLLFSMEDVVSCILLEAPFLTVI